MNLAGVAYSPPITASRDRVVHWTPRQKRKNDVLFAVAAAALRACLALPRDSLPIMGRAVGSAAHALLARERRRAQKNIALVYPSLSEGEQRRFTRRIFRTLGDNLADTLTLLDPREDPARTLSVDDASLAVLRDALAEGRGVIYATCHLGPWERMAALLAKRGFPITTVARESYDPRFHSLLYDRLRADRGVEVIYRGQAGAAAAIVRTLKKGRVLGLLLDLPGRIATTPVTWLGHGSRLPPGAARLALRTRAPVVIGTPAPLSDETPRRGKRTPLVIRITRLPIHDITAGNRGETELSQRIADELSARILRLPAHWPWMHPTFEGASTARTGQSLHER